MYLERADIFSYIVKAACKLVQDHTLLKRFTTPTALSLRLKQDVMNLSEAGILQHPRLSTQLFRKAMVLIQGQVYPRYCSTIPF